MLIDGAVNGCSVISNFPSVLAGKIQSSVRAEQPEGISNIPTRGNLIFVASGFEFFWFIFAGHDMMLCLARLNDHIEKILCHLFFKHGRYPYQILEGIFFGLCVV